MNSGGVAAAAAAVADETTPLTVASNHTSNPTTATSRHRQRQRHLISHDHRSLSMEEKAKLFDEQNEAAMRLSTNLMSLSMDNDDDEKDEEDNSNMEGLSEHEIVSKSLQIDLNDLLGEGGGGSNDDRPPLPTQRRALLKKRKSIFENPTKAEKETLRKMGCMGLLAGAVVVAVIIVIALGEVTTIGLPRRQPVGAYKLIELQEGDSFFDYYYVYEGKDSVGSNGYNNYVNLAYAKEKGIVKFIKEDVPIKKQTKEDEGEKKAENVPIAPPPVSEENSVFLDDGDEDDATTPSSVDAASEPKERNTFDEDRKASSIPPDLLDEKKHGVNDDNNYILKEETFVYMGSAPTEDGPRESVRLEGKTRFSRGLFILDVRHMPAGCGTWPAFWLTDENNWPVNGEIDILEGVNYQTVAKTALHSTKECNMYDVPGGVMTGGWDTAIGIPDKKTGIPDMTLRYAQNCFVYDPHQWLNQGCVAVDDVEGRIGQPLNDNGGGVYVLEWDPLNTHIRSWVFTPHEEMPENLRNAIDTADTNDPVAPDPREWDLPYGYFAIGEGTDCPSSHFKSMHLVINLAFCGSVSGNRYFMDCPKQFETWKTCNDYIKSQPLEIEQEAYWKIKGVYVYQREWERAFSQ